jgi:hypothetical protein
LAPAEKKKEKKKEENFEPTPIMTSDDIRKCKTTQPVCGFELPHA